MRLKRVFVLAAMLVATVATASAQQLTMSIKGEPTDKRSYKVGDYYDDGTKQGVVFEVDKAGKYVKIVSLTESSEELQWAIKSVYRNKIGTESRTNGAENMKKVQAISGWRDKYPAFRWCADLGEGWYLPALEELETLLLNGSVREAVNNTLEARGVTRLPDVGMSRGSWSSTEDSEDKFLAWYVSMYLGDTFSIDKNGCTYVRAVATIYLDAEPKSAVATKNYKVGDYYDDGTKQGVVFEVSDGGRHGKIVSLTMSTQQWADEAVWENKIGADIRTDGAENMKKVQAISGWRELYPAFSWCADLGDGWYLPAIEELKVLLLDESVHEAVNATLKARGSIRLPYVGLPILYWSSTEDSEYEFCAWCVHMGNGDSYYNLKNRKTCVRAVATF